MMRLMHKYLCSAALGKLTRIKASFTKTIIPQSTAGCAVECRHGAARRGHCAAGATSVLEFICWLSSLLLFRQPFGCMSMQSHCDPCLTSVLTQCAGQRAPGLHESQDGLPMRDGCAVCVSHRARRPVRRNARTVQEQPRCAVCSLCSCLPGAARKRIVVLGM